jgi:hypothetical protein
MQPRQTYSRVNTGAPPIPEAGASSQKSMEPRGLEFLPKLSEVTMAETTMITRPNFTLNDMIKAAMDGTLQRADIAGEAVRQLGGTSQEKTAGVDTSQFSTEHLLKLADAIDFVATSIEKGAEIHLPHPDGSNLAKPGGGPNALHVMEAKSISGKNPMQPGHSGGKPAPGPSMERGAHPSMPDNAMATNANMHHPEQPKDPMGNKHAELYSKNLERLKTAGAAPAAPAEPSNPLIDSIRKTAERLKTKVAEDAINPAQISAAPSVDTSKPPPGAAPAGQEVPSRPADVTSQERMIDSNQAAINYTKRDAKADAVADAGRVFVNTPMKDPVLDMVFANSGKAGVKTSSVREDALKLAGARALLSKLASDVAEEAKRKKEGKEKESNMGGGAPPPPGVPSPAFTQ